MRQKFLRGILITVMAGVVAAAIGRPAARDSSRWKLQGSGTINPSWRIATTLWEHPASSAPKGAPLFAKAPVFQLINQKGRPFSSDNLKSKVWVADFIFTSCAGVCPQMTHAMRRLQAELPREIQLVSISVDPRRDTPSALASYARRFGADLRNWTFLTGSEEEIKRLVQKGFRLSLAEGESPIEPITHSVRFLLVDGQGRIRGAFDGTDPKGVEELKKDAKRLLSESLSG